MVKLSCLLALASVVVYSSAQEDFDDCDEPDETTSAVAVTSTVAATTASSSALTSACPVLPSPTSTDTVTTFFALGTTTEVNPATTTVYAGTTTTTYTLAPDQEQFTISVASSTETVFYGATFTSIIFDVVPAKTTVTVPRAADFTPLKCESVYVGPFSTTTFSGTATVNTYSYVSTVSIDSITTLQYFAPLPTTTIDSTVTISRQFTTTITSTRNDPTSTVYAACQGTDNVTPNAPPSKYKYVGQAVPVSGTYSSVVAAIDQVDCCAICQANQQCTASTFYTKPVLGESLNTYLVPSACQLFLKNDTSSTCDASFVGATMQWDYPEIINYFSNGPCGQFSFIFPQGRFQQ